MQAADRVAFAPGKPAPYCALGQAELLGRLRLGHPLQVTDHHGRPIRPGQAVDLLMKNLLQIVLVSVANGARRSRQAFPAPPAARGLAAGWRQPWPFGRCGMRRRRASCTASSRALSDRALPRAPGTWPERHPRPACVSRSTLRQTRKTIGPWRSTKASNASSAAWSSPVTNCSRSCGSVIPPTVPRRNSRSSSRPGADRPFFMISLIGLAAHFASSLCTARSVNQAHAGFSVFLGRIRGFVLPPALGDHYSRSSTNQSPNRQAQQRAGTDVNWFGRNGEHIR